MFPINLNQAGGWTRWANIDCYRTCNVIYINFQPNQFVIDNYFIPDYILLCLPTCSTLAVTDAGSRGGQRNYDTMATIVKHTMMSSVKILPLTTLLIIECLCWWWSSTFIHPQTWWSSVPPKYNLQTQKKTKFGFIIKLLLWLQQTKLKYLDIYILYTPRWKQILRQFSLL